MKLKNFTNLLVSALMACSVMFFANCSDYYGNGAGGNGYSDGESNNDKIDVDNGNNNGNNNGGDNGGNNNGNNNGGGDNGGNNNNNNNGGDNGNNNGNNNGGGDNGGNNNNNNNNNGGSSGGLEGTWTYSSAYKYVFNNGTYEYYISGTPYQKGTYTNNGSSITMTVTHINGSYLSSLSAAYTWLNSGTWYSKEEFKSAYQNYLTNAYEQSIRQSYQQIYDAYGPAQFQQIYGYPSVDAAVNAYLAQVLASYEASVNSVVNSLFPAQSTTTSYSLNGNTLTLGSMPYTRN